MTKYIVTIGLEVHTQLLTKTKIFCGCSTKFGQPPNTQTCPVCLGLPGVLPVLNKKALELAVKTALALNCEVNKFTKFDRKNYFYPDLPKNFQISQYDLPLAEHGSVEIITAEGKNKTIGIKRVHLEEDAGKLIHAESTPESWVDFNRTGNPLLEIVSEPDLHSPEEAHQYLTTLKAILLYLEVSDCNMEEGSLRCDANISLRPADADTKSLGIKTELKNMNSFKGVKLALEHEVKRQSVLLDKGRRLIQETRLWDERRNETVPMRSKEEAFDYRYFPEPDLPPYVLDKAYIEAVKKSLPELPRQRRERLERDYGLSAYDAAVLTADKAMAEYFESGIKFYRDAKKLSNWLTGDISAYLNAHNLDIKQLNLEPEKLGRLLEMVDAGAISIKTAKEILPEMIEKKMSADEIVNKKNLGQISDTAELSSAIDTVLKNNPKPAADYLKGKDGAITFLVGMVMKQTRGRANPRLANEILRKKLEKSKERS
jgi:aspartyl-tRNA(Asn)/glutamyl-tRNA(Gln) amidotransferase subunit B